MFAAIPAALLLGACGVGAPPVSDPTGVDGLVVPTPSPDPADFVREVGNPWLPLLPGSTWRYEVRVDGEVEETIEVTVTDDVRRVAGVDATVVRDVVTDAEGKVVEETLDWFAEDRAGNVWYLGEDTTSYERHRPSTEGSWEAGVDGAMAGLVMPAEPRVGDGFQQEWLPGVAEDRAEVLDVSASRTTAFGSWDDLVLTEDTTPLEPDLVEHKLYAHGVGLVLEESPAGDEVVELVAFTPGGR
ncbi:hypothetical protein DDE18_03910 [Nocardioides gansuensis]|uniref:Uncharacterized protein n=2 Tax=Nocardioides gansuensis TaxID=2138300 RepID=A0A2T8FGB7_9ACTN|nr:hypothetical protein DDE18_03910 [Nocardioides gansuensis]